MSYFHVRIVVACGLDGATYFFGAGATAGFGGFAAAALGFGFTSSSSLESSSESLGGSIPAVAGCTHITKLLQAMHVLLEVCICCLSGCQEIFL